MAEATTTPHVAATKPLNEDWLAVILGLVIVAAGLIGVSGTDPIGWVVTTRVWVDPAAALAPATAGYGRLGGIGAFVLTWLVLTAVLSLGAASLQQDAKRFAIRFSVLFWLAYASWFVGSYAHLAAVTSAEQAKFGIDWSLRLTNEGGYIVALLAGLVIANVFPGATAWLSDAVRPEWYIKTAIVVLGAFIAVTVAERLSFASSILLRGIAAIVEAYLIYWSVVYFIARKWFRFPREWAVPLASGISICGVAAAISTGSAIRARPAIPVLVSSLVVVFAVIELLILPFLAQHFLANDPLVAAAWLGLAVKTDGAAVAGGAITEALINAKAAAGGTNYAAGWIVGTTATIKVFIDIFIGVWSFILAWIWTNHINVTDPSNRARPREIWERFPKFIIGFVVTFAVALGLSLAGGPEVAAKIKGAVGEANNFRVIFFVLTFFSIGLLSNFRKLWAEGIGKLAAVYVISLFGFVIWVGLLISWLFFHGVKPPLA
ncbi:MAG: putative sulfate exporter family transporter [Pandoraea sp.]|nr:putative sulfate exporter family transporter [Pandoraea sp.]MDR3400759.1 putative sulfate exporter family transporter [Pandoraea sp.]